ncbi:TPA: hypothetical protein PTV74_002086 [Clostridium botulinum]|nr:hypothetical protein [Clostridium botulinum]HDK7264286.1 hypothetical protein [Clostridium botulinum]HDK7268307.1 hypothetical protein [Clostridium botulinum]HDK7297399.1 hypothetical protein [Clostridium botulinum]HDK7360731.1 hypothetical protein [Clostridium botulinum]
MDNCTGKRKYNQDTIDKNYEVNKDLIKVKYGPYRSFNFCPFTWNTVDIKNNGKI